MIRQRKIKRFLGLALVALGLLLPLLGFAAPIDNLSYIKDLPLIRLVVSHAPGNGHQSATATVLTRLRQLGYRGEIEVVYTSMTKNQLGYLMPPFNPLGSDEQRFPELKLHFVSNAIFTLLEDQYQEVPLAITGATDSYISPQEMRAQVLLTLQPLKWSMGVESLHTRWKSEDTDSRYLTQLGDMGYVFAIPNPSDPAQFIKLQMQHHEDLADKVGGLQALLRHKSKVDIAMAYGHKMSDSQSLMYARGILWAQDHAPDKFNKGVVMPVVNTLTPNAVAALQLELNNSELGQRVRIANILDLTLEQQIKTLPNNHVLILDLGAVSKPVFEYLYSIGTVAPVVEGRNSMNLMHLIGGPYLPSGDHEGYKFNWVPEIAQKAWMAIDYPIHWAIPSVKLQSQALGEFLVAAKTKNSWLNIRFAAQKISANNLRQDKLYQGLKIANADLKLVSENKKRSAIYYMRQDLKKALKDLKVCIQILASNPFKGRK